MGQLLKSLKSINEFKAFEGRFESHIFFDNATKGEEPTEYLINLVTLVRKIFGKDSYKKLNVFVYNVLKRWN